MASIDQNNIVPLTSEVVDLNAPQAEGEFVELSASGGVAVLGELIMHAPTYGAAAKMAITEAQRDYTIRNVKWVRYLSTFEQTGVKGRIVGVEVRNKSDNKVVARVRIDVDPTKLNHFNKDSMQGSQAVAVLQDDSPPLDQATQRFKGYVADLEAIAPKGLSDEEAGNRVWVYWGGTIA